MSGVSYSRVHREQAKRENKGLVTVSLPGFLFQGAVEKPHIEKLDAFVMYWVTDRFKPTAPGGLYLLQNVGAGYLGNSPVFWRVGGSGYTQWIDEAKRFTEAEADATIQSTRGTHRWAKWPVQDVERLAKRTIDIQDEMSEFRGGAA